MSQPKKQINVISDHVIKKADTQSARQSSTENRELSCGVSHLSISEPLDKYVESTYFNITSSYNELSDDFSNEQKTYTTLKPVAPEWNKEKQKQSVRYYREKEHDIVAERPKQTFEPQDTSPDYIQLARKLPPDLSNLNLPTECIESKVNKYLSGCLNNSSISQIYDFTDDADEEGAHSTFPLIEKTYEEPQVINSVQNIINEELQSNKSANDNSDDLNDDSDPTFEIDSDETNSDDSDLHEDVTNNYVNICENNNIDENLDITNSTEKLPKNYKNISEGKSQVFSNKLGEIHTKVAYSKRKCKIWDKRDLCPFCYKEITHFARHLERNHKEEPKVQKILSLPKGDTERKFLWDCLRKEGNFCLFKDEKKVVAVRRPPEKESENAKSFDDFAVCEFCTGIYKKKTLYRHAKACRGRVTAKQKTGKLYALTQSQTFIAAARCQNDFLLKSRLKNEVFSIMKPDNISAVAKNDLLICLFGETHLKRHKRQQIVTVTSNKMRELARLLIVLRDITPVKSLIEAIKPEYFDDLVAATKVISGFNPENKTFKASSLALHMGTSLKQLCDIVDRLILKKSPLFFFENPDLEKKNTKSLRRLIETNWANEIASLALKDMTEKHWEKPQIIPVTSDIIKFNDHVKSQVEKAANSLNKLNMSEENETTETDKEKEIVSLYKELTKGIMALVLVLNRKRIGELQYLKLSTYLKSFSDPMTQEEMLNSLSASERIVGRVASQFQFYFPPYIQQKINLMLEIRKQIKGIAESNDYLFANPNSSKGWFHGSSVIRSFATKCKATNAASLTSTKFRKQTATILQVMNINESDMEQLAIFMGHTKKTHEEWYRLPQDVYQVAKIAKLLLMIDKGETHKYQGKGLNDIVVTESDCLEIEMEDQLKADKMPINKNNAGNHLEPEDMDNEACASQHGNSSDEKSEVKKVKPQISKAKKKTERQRWSDKEKKIMCKYFKSFIQNKIVPKKKDVDEFQDKEKELFGHMHWIRIKTFVYNTYKK
ncbi:hypothetical protein NQ315_011239 [Exocentrus adspersus]|uniref:Uncharacterized protein n=1 Tax=Exocentrus adspersus TaxID=1586481 RepID=A0AAV8V4U8_9CUCU|nr:hypothetical protein NQ315_011239 [Exocentrus adspersus]